MPVKSSTSSVLIWPSADAVIDAARHWASRVGADSAACFWSDASDPTREALPALAAISTSLSLWPSPTSRSSGAALWDTTLLPVPADLLVYTSAEWTGLQHTAFGRTLTSDMLWLFERPRIAGA
jgi:hypothetical protein